MSNWAKIYLANSLSMIELADNSIHLVVTSPPYWSIKNYGSDSQIGYGQTLHEYLKDLYRVWSEVFRVLQEGRRLIINIGDQFARTIIYGRYKIIPLHSEIIAQCEDIGFDYMGSVIWQKKTTMNTTGGATVMGSYPYPPNGMIEIDYEYILIFKKPGKSKKIPLEIKEKSKLTKDEWKEYFYGHWYFGGAKQVEHQAMFPEELPKRLIKMFSFKDEIVLDPFLGSGTTAKVALKLNRNAIGYEINSNFKDIIRTKISVSDLLGLNKIDFVERKEEIKIQAVDYVPRIKDAKPNIEPEKIKFGKDKYYKVIEILKNSYIKLETGLIIKLKGIKIVDYQKTFDYLKQYVLNKKIFLKFDKNYVSNGNPIEAYVFLKNKIFINKSLIKNGWAIVDEDINFDYKENFRKITQIN